MNDAYLEWRTDRWAEGYFRQWEKLETVDRARFVRNLAQAVGDWPQGESTEACRRALDLISRADPTRCGYEA